MRGAAWWYWAGLLVFAVVPIASTLLGLGVVNMLTVGGLCILWLAWPSVGSVLYTATWINLVGYRLVHTILARDRLRTAFPMTVNNQNGASAWLMILGVLGALRSGFAGDGLGIALGVIGAAVLFFLRARCFSLRGSDPMVGRRPRKQKAHDVDPALYALQKFSAAVRTLAVGPGDVRSCLLTASLGFHTVRVEDLPGGLRRHLRWIERMLTRSAPRWKGEGRLQAWLGQMQNRAGARIARRTG